MKSPAPDPLADCRDEKGGIDTGKFSLRFWKERHVSSGARRRRVQKNIDRALAALDHAIAEEAYYAALVAHFQKHGNANPIETDESVVRLVASQRAEYAARKKIEFFPARFIELPPDL